MAANSNEPSLTGDVFEGANQVLRGLQRQLAFWQTLDGRAEDQKLMVPALVQATAALYDALERTKARGGG